MSSGHRAPHFALYMSSAALEQSPVTNVYDKIHPTADDTQYVRPRGLELLYLTPGLFYNIANILHVKGAFGITHLAQNGRRAMAEVALRHPRVRATLAESAPGLPASPHFVIPPRVSEEALSRMFLVVDSKEEDGPRHWERIVHSRINTPFPRSSGSGGYAYQIVLVRGFKTLPGHADDAHVILFW